MTERTIICKCCNRVTIAGLTRTEEALVSRLWTSVRPLPASELWSGLAADMNSAAVQISRLRKKLEPHGFTIPDGGKGRGHHAFYCIQVVERSQ